MSSSNRVGFLPWTLAGARIAARISTAAVGPGARIAAAP